LVGITTFFAIEALCWVHQQLPFNVQLSMVQSARLGLDFVVVAISEVRHELERGGTVIMLPPAGDIAPGLISPVTH
jgi:hypothetical protein